MKNKNRNSFYFIFLILFLLIGAPTYSQEKSDSLYKKGNPLIVITKDKTEIFGISGGLKDSILTLKKGVKDSVMFPLSTIRNVYLADENNFLRGKYIRPDSLYMFNPTFATAFPLRKGSTFLRTYYFSFAAVHHSLSRFATISYYSSVSAVPVAVNLRMSVRISGHLRIAPEAGVLSASWAAPRIWMWMAGARASQGGSLKNVTVGAGYAVVNGFDEYIPLMKKKYKVTYINIGIKQRLNKRFSLAGDFWYIHKPNIYMGGLFLTRHRSSVSQWGVGCLFLSFRILSRRVNIPAPVLQWNMRL